MVAVMRLRTTTCHSRRFNQFHQCGGTVTYLSASPVSQWKRCNSECSQFNWRKWAYSTSE